MQAWQTRTWSTPMVIGSSVVMAVTGVLLFFHLGEGFVKTPHEWVGLIFVAGMLLHILNHLKGFTRYFSQGMANTIMAACLVITFGIMGASLMGSEGGEGGHPAKRMVSKVENAPLTLVAALNNQPVEVLMSRFEASGISNASESSTLKELAEANGQHTFELMSIALEQ